MSVRIIAYFVFVVDIVSGQICVNIANFPDYCESQYGGVAVGGRCFFLARNPSDKSVIRSALWTTAFGICKDQGDNAILAQIYSEIEMSAIWGKFSAEVAALTWIALRNNPQVALGTPAINTDATRWYSDASTYEGKITPNNTFLRNRINDDFEPGDAECIVLYAYQNEIRFGDLNCDYASFALCLITDCNQDFIQTPGCFMEPAIQSEKGMNVSECATACADEIWCRTFNYHSSEQRCDLFALRADDAAGSVQLSSFTGCCSMYVVKP